MTIGVCVGEYFLRGQRIFGFVVEQRVWIALFAERFEIGAMLFDLGSLFGFFLWVRPVLAFSVGVFAHLFVVADVPELRCLIDGVLGIVVKVSPYHARTKLERRDEIGLIGLVAFEASDDGNWKARTVILFAETEWQIAHEFGRSPVFGTESLDLLCGEFLDLHFAHTLKDALFDAHVPAVVKVLVVLGRRRTRSVHEVDNYAFKVGIWL